MGNLKDDCSGLFGQYNGNIKLIKKESTDRLFYLIKNPNLEVSPSKNIKKGKFYLIKYNYNGNKIWCPIFVIDDRYVTTSQKRIIYSINLDYLPLSPRITFFDIILDSNYDIIEFNKKQNELNIDQNGEKPLKITFENIYKLLKNNGGYNYSITAYDYMKIDGMTKQIPMIFGVSTNFCSRFMYVDTKKYNMVNMRDLSIKLDELDIKRKLNDLISTFESIKTEMDKNDVKETYKKLKNIEKKFNIINR